MNIEYTSADEAVKLIRPGQRIFAHGSAATPNALLRALVRRANELKGCELTSVSIYSGEILDNPAASEAFFINSLFVSSNVRQAVNSGHGDYIPIFLSEIPKLFEQRILPLDVALLQVSPPDKHGFCSLGTSVDVARAAFEHARIRIAQVNKQMPRTHGDGIVNFKDLDAAVWVDEPLPEANYHDKSSPVTAAIGRHITGLIEDGSTLQMGIGTIPDEVLSCLGNHKDLGVHTEMFSDGLLPLIEKGVVNNKLKTKHPGKTIASFVLGTRKLYDFVDDNPEVGLLGIDYVNDEKVIRSNPRMIAINGAIEVDITGQVCADSIGTYQYSGVGGQMDFMRGAALSEGGKPIIAMASTTHKGESRIVPMLKPGAGVVTTRAHVHYVVTEYGVAYLFGKNLRQRAMELMRIAHPDHRETLEKAIHERFGVRLFSLS